MTRDEIMKMEPGRELDALVAEYVVGMKEHRKAYPESFDERVIWFRNPPNVTAYYVPFYSTDISAAFDVWEHDRPKKWNFDLCYSDGTYLAEIYKPDDIGVRILAQVESKSAAEAMVKCRLLALMGEGEIHD